jgi:hypothetical protein
MDALYKKQLVIVLEEGSFLSRIIDQEGRAFTVKTTELKPVPVKKLTKVEQTLNQDPEILRLFVPFVSRILISCSPKDGDLSKCVQDISENSDIAELEAVEYIRVVTDKSHGAKFDILVDADIPQDVRDRMSVFFHEDGHRATSNELQINSRSLALWLLGNSEIRPQKAH